MNASEQNFTIEPMTAANIDAANEMRIQSWMDTYENEALGVTNEWLEDHLKDQWSEEFKANRLKRLENPNWAGWVALDGNGNIVGSTSPYIDKEGVRHIGSLYVDKAWHGKGVGGALMQKNIDWHGADAEIILEVVAYNDRAKAFYRKWDFDEIPGTEEIYANKIPVVTMIRNQANATKQGEKE